MCGQYTVNVNATGQSTVEDIYIEIDAPANTEFYLKRIRITPSTLSFSESTSRFFVKRESTVGSGGVAFTPIPKSPNITPAASTVKVKNGASAFTLGTVTDTFFNDGFYSRASVEWIARDRNDYIWSGEGNALIITGFGSQMTNNVSFECDFVE